MKYHDYECESPKKYLLYDLSGYFRSDTYTPTAQLISSFVFGAIFAPWSWGIIFLLIFFVIYEILFYMFTGGDPRYWQPETRMGVFCAYLLGWIMIRTIISEPVVQSDNAENNTFSTDLLNLSIKGIKII